MLFRSDYQAPVAPAEFVEEPVLETHAALEHASVAMEAEPELAAEPADQEPAAPQYGDWRDDVPVEEPLPEAAAFDYADPHQVQAEAYEPPVEHSVDVPAPALEPVAPQPAPGPLEDDFPYPIRGQQAEAEISTGWNEPRTFDVAPQVEEPVQAEAPAPAESWGWGTPAATEVPAVPVAQEEYAATVWDDVPELVQAGPVVPIDHHVNVEHVDAHFDTETHVAADTVRMPPVADLPDLAPHVAAAAVPVAAAAVAIDDPLADFLDTPQKPVETKPAETKATDTKASDDPWSDLEDLIGFNKDGGLSGSASRGGGLHTDAEADDLMSTPTRPYRVTPVRKRNYAGILLAIVGLALVGGGGYAIWLNRDSLNDMVDGLIQSSLPASQTAQQSPQRSAPASTSPTPAPATSNARPPTTPATPSTPAATSPTNTAANSAAAPRPADGSTAVNKFTQRLMPDGTESDQGPGVIAGLAQNAEGQSVAQLNAPAAVPPGANANAASPATPLPNGTVPAAPAAGPAVVPAVTGEKMFLYEERIGQAAPTAIEGSVSWSLQREAGRNGRQEPVIQGRLNIPGRGLSALVTVKRNSDTSLPASHLIEIVFSVPPDFEGGAIDSVQRIAMKSTEQDRGAALIAVPAKITDDFHMIALNDFPDARNTNMELLRTRNWMDIPIAYRNGRRALLTLQKGAEGERVFNEAIREWGAMGPTASGQ